MEGRTEGKLLLANLKKERKKRMQLDVLKEQIDAQVVSFMENARIFMEKGNKSAGKRSRLATNALTKLFKDWRKLSMDASKEE